MKPEELIPEEIVLAVPAIDRFAAGVVEELNQRNQLQAEEEDEPLFARAMTNTTSD